MAGEQGQNARHRYPVTVLAPTEPADRGAAVLQLARLVIGIKRQRESAAGATRPGRRAQGSASADLIDEAAPVCFRPLPGLEGRGGAGCVRHDGLAIRGNPHDVSPDGKQIVSMVGGGGGIFVTRLEGTEEERTSRAFVQSDEPTTDPRFSPDGRWIVYQSGGLFVQPFPGPGRRQQVTPFGQDPEWGKDGKEIIYLGREGVMAVAVETAGSQLRFGAPRNLFSRLRNQPAQMLLPGHWRCPATAHDSTGLKQSNSLIPT